MLSERFFFFLVSCFHLINTKLNASIEKNQMSKLSMGDKEQILINKLLKGYSKKQKPNGAIVVKFALNLNQIVSVKAKDQLFMLNVFLDHEWTDNRLSWSNYFWLKKNLKKIFFKQFTIF